jgi:hypothetical protein
MNPKQPQINSTISSEEFIIDLLKAPDAKVRFQAMEKIHGLPLTQEKKW